VATQTLNSTRLGASYTAPGSHGECLRIQIVFSAFSILKVVWVFRKAAELAAHKYCEFTERRFLKRHGFETRAQYDRFYDPDYNLRATRVKDYYHGYPYVYCFDDREHTIYFWDLGYDGHYVINKWCKENLKDKFRFDYLRVFQDSYTQEWHINEIGGGDYSFIACKDRLDMAAFKLRWA
jgi:hypothetical protein